MELGVDRCSWCMCWNEDVADVMCAYRWSVRVGAPEVVLRALARIIQTAFDQVYEPHVAALRWSQFLDDADIPCEEC